MKKCKLLSMFLFLAVIILPGILWAELKVFMPELYEQYSADLGENRDKATISEPAKLLTSGDQLIEFYNDRVPFRSLLIKTEQTLNNKLEKHYRAQISPFFYALAGKKDKGEQTGQTDVVDVSNVGFLDQNEENTSASTNPEDIIASLEPEEVDPDSCNHDWFQQDLYEGSCVEDGWVTYECSLCHFEKTFDLGKGNHEKVETKVVEADYLNYGRTESVCAYCGKSFVDNLVPKLVDDSYLAPVTLNSNTLIGRFNFLFYDHLKSLDYYKGNNLPTAKELKNYEDALALLNLACELRGKKLVVLICPNKETVYPEYMPSVNVVSSTKRVDIVAEHIKDNTTVKFVYPVSELKTMDVFYKTYRMYDTHWNQMGAFVGTQTLYQALELTTTDPRSLTVIDNPFMGGGDLISLGGLNIDNYEPDAKGDYDYFIDYRYNNNVLTETEGDYNILPVFKCEMYSYTYDKKIIMIGDSFRTRMIPFVKRDFKYSVFAHRDNLEDVAEEFKDADYVILSTVERDEKTIIETAFKMAEIISRYP